MTYSRPSPKMQRSHGAALVSLMVQAGRVRQTDLAQSGSAKVILPHHGAGFDPRPEVVFLNPSGGPDRGRQSALSNHRLREYAPPQTRSPPGVSINHSVALPE